MIVRETCYFCTSPFQLLSILSLAAQRDEQADLYIDPQFTDAALFAEGIRETGLFEHVTVMDADAVYRRFFTAEEGLKNHIQIARSYLFVGRIARMLLGEDVTYRNMFVSSRAYLPRMVYFSYLKKKTGTELHYFDDGVGSYFQNAASAPKKSDALVRRILFGKKAIDLDHDKYLLFPELYAELNPAQTDRIRKIDFFWNRDGGIRTINDIFRFRADARIPESVILLEEPFSLLFAPGEHDRIREIIDGIFRTFGIDNAVIKKHPRSKDEWDPAYKSASSYGIPFEVFCMNEDMREKVLISYGSTAVATPKLMLEQEPYVILLYRLLDARRPFADLVDRYFRYIQSRYSRPGRFLIPSTREELRDAVDQILKEKQGTVHADEKI